MCNCNHIKKHTLLYSKVCVNETIQTKEIDLSTRIWMNYINKKHNFQAIVSIFLHLVNIL